MPNRVQPGKLACELPRQANSFPEKACVLDLNLLTATAAARAIAAGEITAEDLTRSCLARARPGGEHRQRPDPEVRRPHRAARAGGQGLGVARQGARAIRSTRAGPRL